MLSHTDYKQKCQGAQLYTTWLKAETKSNTYRALNLVAMGSPLVCKALSVGSSNAASLSFLGVLTDGVQGNSRVS